MQAQQHRQSGQGLIEYGLILVIVSVALILFLMTMGQQLVNLFSNITTSLGH
jgi:Flp pilus assembly pilin Flp